MKRVSFRYILTLGICALFACSPATPIDLPTALKIYDDAFARAQETRKFVVRWTGDEHFCIAWNHADSPLRSIVPNSIRAVSGAYNLSFSINEVDDVAQCDKSETDLYVWIGSNPGDEKLLDVLEDIGGSRPPKDYLTSSSLKLGLTTHLPGPRYREFIFVNDVTETRHHSIFDPKAVFFEELLQALLGARDIKADRLVSQIAAQEPNGGYARWYEFNARGWCTVDFLFLELVFGESSSTRRSFESVRRYLKSNFSALSDAALRRRALLTDLADDRC